MKFTDSLSNPYSKVFAIDRPCFKQSKTSDKSVKKAPTNLPFINEPFHLFSHGK